MKFCSNDGSGCTEVNFDGLLAGSHFGVGSVTFKSRIHAVGRFVVLLSFANITAGSKDTGLFPTTFVKSINSASLVM